MLLDWVHKSCNLVVRIYAKISPKMVNPRDVVWNAEEEGGEWSGFHRATNFRDSPGFLED